MMIQQWRLLTICLMGIATFGIPNKLFAQQDTISKKQLSLAPKTANEYGGNLSSSPDRRRARTW